MNNNNNQIIRFVRHDRSGRKPTNQIVKLENEKQAWDI